MATITLSKKSISGANFKTGQKFRACKNNGKIIEGIIHKSISGNIYLCQNESSWNGSTSSNKHGFKYSWSIGSFFSSPKSDILGLEIISNKTKFTPLITKLETQLAKVQADLAKIKADEAKELVRIKELTEKPKRFSSWSISKVGESYSFGCGSVKFTKAELAAFNKVMLELDKRKPKLAAQRYAFYQEAITVSGKLSK